MIKVRIIIGAWHRHIHLHFRLSDDDDVARKISDKLRVPGVQGISFCNIAKKAQELGRKNLAIKVSSGLPSFQNHMRHYLLLSSL